MTGGTMRDLLRRFLNQAGDTLAELRFQGG